MHISETAGKPCCHLESDDHALELSSVGSDDHGLERGSVESDDHALELSSVGSDDHDLERGSVESGLVLIPTTLFFLMALQLLLAGSWQTIERARLHDIVIESSIHESVEGGANQAFDGESTYLRGGVSESGFGDSLKDSTSITVQNKLTPIGELRTFEMKTELPILGRFFQSIDGGIFQIKNYAVSFVS